MGRNGKEAPKIAVIPNVWPHLKIPLAPQPSSVFSKLILFQNECNWEHDCKTTVAPPTNQKLLFSWSVCAQLTLGLNANLFFQPKKHNREATTLCNVK